MVVMLVAPVHHRGGHLAVKVSNVKNSLLYDGVKKC